jgi:hypothetical protein
MPDESEIEATRNTMWSALIERLQRYRGITMGRIFVIAGKFWLSAAAAVIAVNYLIILYNEGMWKLWESNLWHALVTLLINGVAFMLPGIALIGLGKMLGDDY